MQIINGHVLNNYYVVRTGINKALDIETSQPLWFILYLNYSKGQHYTIKGREGSLLAQFCTTSLHS
jgi:hypothetical protein